MSEFTISGIEWHTISCSSCKRDVRAPEGIQDKTCRWCTLFCTACGSDAITDEQMRVFIHRTCNACGFVSVMPPKT